MAYWFVLLFVYVTVVCGVKSHFLDCELYRDLSEADDVEFGIDLVCPFNSLPYRCSVDSENCRLISSDTGLAIGYIGRIISPGTGLAVDYIGRLSSLGTGMDVYHLNRTIIPGTKIEYLGRVIMFNAKHINNYEVRCVDIDTSRTRHCPKPGDVVNFKIDKRTDNIFIIGNNYTIYRLPTNSRVVISCDRMESLYMWNPHTQNFVKVYEAQRGSYEFRVDRSSTGLYGCIENGFKTKLQMVGRIFAIYSYNITYEIHSTVGSGPNCKSLISGSHYPIPCNGMRWFGYDVNEKEAINYNFNTNVDDTSTDESIDISTDENVWLLDYINSGCKIYNHNWKWIIFLLLVNILYKYA
jgi:hypothetical protein